MSLAVKLLQLPILAWRWVLAPVLGNNCRYSPSCSTYALEALTVHGAWRGGYLTLRRLLRCHPWGGCGYDPVPGKHRHHHTSSPNDVQQR